MASTDFGESVRADHARRKSRPPSVESTADGHGRLEPSFEKLLALLAEGGVGFVLVAGVAVTLPGYVRLTGTVDILIERSPENIGRLLEAFE